MFTLSTKIRCTSSKLFGISGHKNYTHLFWGKPWAPHMLFFDVPNFVLLGLSNGRVLLCESTSKVETGQQSWSLLFHLSIPWHPWDWYICHKRMVWLTFMGHVQYTIYVSYGNDPEPENWILGRYDMPSLSVFQRGVCLRFHVCFRACV